MTPKIENWYALNSETPLGMLLSYGNVPRRYTSPAGDSTLYDFKKRGIDELPYTDHKYWKTILDLQKCLSLCIYFNKKV